VPALDPTDARSLFAGARVARLVTADPAARPHVVPLAFAIAGDTVYSAVDAKPKATPRLRRLANIASNPAVALLADHYDDEDWSALWWVRGDGTARLLEPTAREAALARDALAARYAQYRDEPPAGTVIAIDVERWSGWAASG
jgi:PPOX class probable F420-dependent enzyme